MIFTYKELLLKYKSAYQIEKAIKNLKEVNCSVLGDYEECNASECEELDKTADILSYEDKYISGGKKNIPIKYFQQMVKRRMK